MAREGFFNNRNQNNNNNNEDSIKQVKVFIILMFAIIVVSCFTFLNGCNEVSSKMRKFDRSKHDDFFNNDGNDGNDGNDDSGDKNLQLHISHNLRKEK